ncbi:MAG: tetratricopeptide repeat protein [Planctomycetaceae bacterium]|nr:tetratricopeptide repeat protein [Planctomycetaceae bacterium]
MNRSSTGNMVFVVWCLWMLLVSAIPWPLFECNWLTTHQLAEALLFYPATVLFGLAAMIFLLPTPASRVERLARCLGVAISIVVPIACWTGRYRWLIVSAFAGLLRAGILLLWLSPLVFAMLVLWTIRRGTLKWHPRNPAWLRASLALTLSILALEGTARLLETRPELAALLPKTLPEPPPDVVSLAAVGGSTMKGFPYDSCYGMMRVAAWRLQKQFAAKKVELQNVAETGLDLHLALAELRHLSYRPNVLVVYSGHNEFFHRQEELALDRRNNWESIDPVLLKSALFRICLQKTSQFIQAGVQPAIDRQFCGDRIAPDRTLQLRVSHYRSLLIQLAEWAQRHSVSLVYCIPASDISDFAPNVSWDEHAGPATEQTLLENWRQIRQLMTEKNWPTALEEALSLVSEYPTFAEFHFLAGSCYRHLGDFDNARKHLKAARDLDQFPIRATQPYLNAVREVASLYHIPLIDAEAVILSNASEPLTSREQFLDGVHPDLKAHYQLGNAIFDALSPLLPTEKPAGNSQHASDRASPTVTFEQSIRDLNVTPKQLALAYDVTASVLIAYNKRRDPPSEERLKLSEEFARMAEGLRSGTILPGTHGTESLSNTE